MQIIPLRERGPPNRIVQNAVMSAISPVMNELDVVWIKYEKNDNNNVWMKFPVLAPGKPHGMHALLNIFVVGYLSLYSTD